MMLAFDTTAPEVTASDLMQNLKIAFFGSITGNVLVTRHKCSDKVEWQPGGGRRWLLRHSLT